MGYKRADKNRRGNNILKNFHYRHQLRKGADQDEKALSALR